RSILIAGALLHDIGKIQEFGFDTFPFDYTVKGRLVGHLVIGVDMVQEKIRELPDFPEELGVRLKHLILSHHGRHEFGSPALPMMREAFILHFLDDLDAKINYINRLEDQAQDSGYQWTEYQRNLERFLFVNGHASREEPQKIQDRKSPDITDNTTGPKQMSFLE
ncbi:MAG: HD domain-containing protein, partial [Desulfobulbaceae bacterium]|nr:HD domain-containing protein [Desulfobulbaceae bacterium]